VLPELLPAGIDPNYALIWFGVMLAMNMQTSFLTPPFGFALFYLRSVAAKKDYKDRVTGEMIPAVTTPQIYKGAIAFIVLQLIMVSAVVLKPELVLGHLDKPVQLDEQQLLDKLQSGREALENMGPRGDAPRQEDDPMKGLLDAIKEDKPGEKKP
jgi:hypothetical protein